MVPGACTIFRFYGNEAKRYPTSAMLAWRDSVERATIRSWFDWIIDVIVLMEEGVCRLHWTDRKVLTLEDISSTDLST
jgi:hypothetical protein